MRQMGLIKSFDASTLSGQVKFIKGYDYVSCANKPQPACVFKKRKAAPDTGHGLEIKLTFKRLYRTTWQMPRLAAAEAALSEEGFSDAEAQHPWAAVAASSKEDCRDGS